MITKLVGILHKTNPTSYMCYMCYMCSHNPHCTFAFGFYNAALSWACLFHVCLIVCFKWSSKRNSLTTHLGMVIYMHYLCPGTCKVHCLPICSSGTRKHFSEGNKGENVFLMGQISKICWKWLIFAIFSFWWRGASGRKPLTRGEMPPCPLHVLPLPIRPFGTDQAILKVVFHSNPHKKCRWIY